MFANVSRILRPARTGVLLLIACCAAHAVRADEGMWLFSDPPRRILKEKYHFTLTDAWLEHAQKASVRFNSGGSGSFVSADGLIVTNHHIGAGSLQKLSPKGKDYHRDGYYARSRIDELKCPDLELNVLQSIEDVTARVNAAVKAEMKLAEAFAARRGVMAEIEKDSLAKTGLRSDVVTLYHGGLYHLYRYKKYTDVRLVMAPEHAIAFFGGDTDNFEYPRFNLDICFFRAYEDGKPVQPKHWFKWSEQGPSEGELVFVTGHPGTTNRLETVAQLIHRRDVALPYALYRLRTLEAALRQFAERGPEQRRQASRDLHRVANARKALAGQYEGLLTPSIVRAKWAEEVDLQRRLAKLTSEPGSGKYMAWWQQVGDAQKQLTTFEKEYLLLERGDAFFSDLFSIARHLVRLSVEVAEPNSKRLREYRDSNLESLKFQLFSPAPISAELEKAKLATSLTFLAENLGGSHSLVDKVFAGRSPVDRAAELVQSTQLFSPAERKRLADGGRKAIEASTDPMVRLALLVEPESRRLRKRYEDEIEEVERQAYARIAEARFKALGSSVAPDATFTLRLAFGVVKGYTEDGAVVPYTTTFGGAFDRADKQGHKEPFELPRRWLDGKAKLDLNTPFNFVSTADTIGGNSGSPVLNRSGELVGINFDRNRYGLVRNFVYTEEQARHVSVHSRGVLEALRRLYDAEPLVRELTAGR